MVKTIGTVEARTHWSEVLQEVRNGQRYIITQDGEAVAELVPHELRTRQERSRIAAMHLLHFMERRNPVDVDIKDAIEDGRH